MLSRRGAQLAIPHIQQKRGTYLHVEIESDNQELLQQLSNWMNEAIQVMSASFDQDATATLVTNKVRNKA